VTAGGLMRIVRQSPKKVKKTKFVLKNYINSNLKIKINKYGLKFEKKLYF